MEAHAVNTQPPELRGPKRRLFLGQQRRRAFHPTSQVYTPDAQPSAIRERQMVAEQERRTNGEGNIQHLVARPHVLDEAEHGKNIRDSGKKGGVAFRVKGVDVAYKVETQKTRTSQGDPARRF